MTTDERRELEDIREMAKGLLRKVDRALEKSRLPVEAGVKIEAGTTVQRVQAHSDRKYSRLLMNEA